MPRFISKDGVFHPAKEVVGLVNNSSEPFKHPVTGEMIQPGAPYIYEGPDRAALYMLWNEDKSGKITTLGQDFRRNPEFIETWRKLNFKSDEEYLVYVGYDKVQSEKEFNEKASVIAKHDLPKRIKALQVAGGGSDSSGAGNDRYGGFGNQPKV